MIGDGVLDVLNFSLTRNDIHFCLTIQVGVPNNSCIYVFMYIEYDLHDEIKLIKYYDILSLMYSHTQQNDKL